MTVYIAGKITGLDEEVYIALFDKYESKWKELGFNVINPTKIFNKAQNYDEIMGRCLKLIELSDILYLLPNWKESKGAKQELEYAKKLNKIIMASYQPTI